MPDSTKSPELRLSPDEHNMTALELMAYACGGLGARLTIGGKSFALRESDPIPGFDYLLEEFDRHAEEIRAAALSGYRKWKEARASQLHSMPYDEFLQTSEWAAQRIRALNRADNRCQVCNADQHLNVHHRTYARRGNEDAADLIVLCAACHKLFHDNGRLVK